MEWKDYMLDEFTLGPYESEFLAKEELITIYPTIDGAEEYGLASFGHVPKLVKSQPQNVPIWFALELKSRRLCTLVPPPWLNIDILTKIWSQEKSNPKLLPLSYYWQEIAKLFLLHAGSDLGTGDQRHDIKTLIRSIEDVRATKIFAMCKVLDDFGLDDVPHLLITNITSGEIIRFRKFLKTQIQGLFAIHLSFLGQFDQHRRADEKRHAKYFQVQEQLQKEQDREAVQKKLHMRREQLLLMEKQKSLLTNSKKNTNNDMMMDLSKNIDHSKNNSLNNNQNISHLNDTSSSSHQSSSILCPAIRGQNSSPQQSQQPSIPTPLTESRYSQKVIAEHMAALPPPLDLNASTHSSDHILSQTYQQLQYTNEIQDSAKLSLAFQDEQTNLSQLVGYPDNEHFRDGTDELGSPRPISDLASTQHSTIYNNTTYIYKPQTSLQGGIKRTAGELHQTYSLKRQDAHEYCQSARSEMPNIGPSYFDDIPDDEYDKQQDHGHNHDKNP